MILALTYVTLEIRRLYHGPVLTAARRLGELNDPRAIEGLRRRATSARKEGFLFFARSCGHDEAAQALRRLNAAEPAPER